MTRIGIVLALVVTAGACRSRLTGNEGNLAFVYDADDQVNDFNKPVAVGARLDLTVEGVGRNEPVPVVSATSATPDVLGVASFSGSVVTVEGKSAGSAKLDVEATVDGTNKSDSVNMLVAVPEVLKLRHTCTDARDARYFTNNRVVVPFDMEKKNGQPVIGYGLYPVTAVPSERVTVDRTSKSQTLLQLDTGSTPGDVTLASTIDDTTLTLKLVAESQVDGARAADEVTVVQAGRKAWRLIWPTVAGEAVCQPKTEVSVAGKTAEICAVSAVPTAREDDALGLTWGWVEIDAQRPGTCRFTVTYPRAAAGAGVTQEFTVTVN